MKTFRDYINLIENAEQGVAEAVPAQAGAVDPKIQFLQPTIQFAEKLGYQVTLNPNPNGKIFVKLVNKQIEHTVRIGFSRGRDPGTKLEADMSDNWDSQTYAWSAKELAQDFKEFYKDALRDSPTQGQQGVAEGKGLAKKVKIVKGPDAGKTGWIREVKHGAFKGAPKTYYIDLDDGGQANNLPATALRLVKEQGVAEGHADQQRKIFKKNGQPVGEVGIDRESSPGNGQWYMKCYSNGIDNVGYDSYEEAVAELKHCIKQGMAEGKRTVKENATGGVTGASSVAVSMTTLGEKGGFSKQDLKKKFESYGNSLSRGGPVKPGKK